MILHGRHPTQPRSGMNGPMTAEEAKALHEMARQHIVHANALAHAAYMSPGIATGFGPTLQQVGLPLHPQMVAQQMMMHQMVAQQMAAAQMQPRQLAPPMELSMVPPQGSPQQIAAHLSRLSLAQQGPVGLPTTAPSTFLPTNTAQGFPANGLDKDADGYGGGSGGSSAQQVCQQGEYYFSNHNLASDSFMRDHIAANPGGWVDVVLINSFSRMMRLGLSVQDVRCNAALLQPNHPAAHRALKTGRPLARFSNAPLSSAGGPRPRPVPRAGA